MPRYSRRVYRSVTGAGLCLHSWEARGEPRAILLVSHGAGEDGLAHAWLAERTAAAGFAVHAPDHRGHGRTTVADTLPGTFARRHGALLAVADLASLAATLAARHPGLPLVLFGNGMGASLALAAAAQIPLRTHALVLWNAGSMPGWKIRLGRLMTAIERFRRGSDTASPFGRRTMATQGADNPTVGVTRDMLALIARLERDRFLRAIDRDMPMLVTGGPDAARLRRRLERLGFRRLHGDLSRPDARQQPDSADDVVRLLDWIAAQLPTPAA